MIREFQILDTEQPLTYAKQKYDPLSLSVINKIYEQLPSISGKDFQSCQKVLLKIRAKKNIQCVGKSYEKMIMRK